MSSGCRPTTPPFGHRPCCHATGVAGCEEIDGVPSLGNTDSVKILAGHFSGEPTGVSDIELDHLKARLHHRPGRVHRAPANIYDTSLLHHGQASLTQVCVTHCCVITHVFSRLG